MMATSPIELLRPYQKVLDSAVEACNVRERVLAAPVLDVRALVDADRDLQYVVEQLIALGKGLASVIASPNVQALLQRGDQHLGSSLFRVASVVFREALPAMVPHLQHIKTLLARQTRARTISDAQRDEPGIQQELGSIQSLMNGRYRNEFVSLAHENPGSREEQYLASPKGSFWVIVKLIAVIDIYLQMLQVFSLAFQQLAAAKR